ncbi:MAG TPA: hypothetical protein EYH05_07370, partial [Anaerolineae bacterium]|nr:hypothetical protein [Anaerolineae bacterium]
YSQYVQPGDVVLAIDGRPVRRGQPIFTPPVKPAYELTLQRGEEIFTQEIVVVESQLFRMLKLSHSFLALAIWFIGFMTVQFARPEQSPAVYVGLGFQLIAAGIVSAGPSQLGAPGAWIVGNVLIFYFPLIMLYLSFMPGNTPLNALAQTSLRGSLYLLTGLAIVATVEVLFLFPERSLKDVAGISTLTVLTILAGISIMAAIVILLARLIRSPKHSYERQQLTILFVFLALAVIPLFFFVILPVGQFIFVPFPFVYSLFLLAPAGYFFVLHRQGYLELDTLFSRIMTIVVLIVAVGMAYATGMYLLDAVFHVDVDGAGRGGFVFFLLGVAIAGQKQVQSYVDLLLYGRDPLGDESIQEAKVKLSANPEPATVAGVIAQVAAYLGVQQVAVLARDGEQYTLLAGNTPSFIVSGSALGQEIYLRARDPGSLACLPQWVELSVPITARGDGLGLLLLSRPVNGYFNARQVKILQDIADILAFSLLVISLVETMQELSRQALYEKELQRQQIATEIHNEPLHTLTTVTMQLQRGATDEARQDAARTIRQVTRDLRRIISGLRPPALKESVEWMTRQIVREFDETHDDIRVAQHLGIRSSQQASQQTKAAFYYILTEALNNIHKHARATRVDVTLCYDEAGLTLEVRDNGVGAAVVTRPLTELLRGHYLGVADMHRWASIGGGQLEIGPNEPTGTIVKLTLPSKREGGL